MCYGTVSDRLTANFAWPIGRLVLTFKLFIKCDFLLDVIEVKKYFLIGNDTH